MATFRRIKVGEARPRTPEEWFTPLVNPELYKPLKPAAREEVWSGSEGELFAARIPDWGHVPTLSYAASRALTEEVLNSLGGDFDKVLVKPDSCVTPGLFFGDERLRLLARKSGVSLHADFQPLAVQPAVLAGIVDALIDAGASEVHIALDSPWVEPERIAWELGYSAAMKGRENKVAFVELYGEKEEVEELPIKWIEGYDLGFFKYARPPRALFDEGYDLVFIASLAKTHCTAIYSLLLKTFGATWTPRRFRWHIQGAPLKLFDREYVEQILGEEVPEDRNFEVLWAGERVVLSNGYASSAPLPACVEGGEILVVSDPHLHATNLAPFTLSMGYLITRYLGMYATVVDELEREGVDVAGLISGVVGMEGEGPLVYGRRRFGGFMLAGASPLALEVLALDAMFGEGGGFEEVLVKINERFCRDYMLSEEAEEEVMVEAADPWTLRLAEELLREERDPSRYTLTLLDFEGGEEVQVPWDLRIGPPFEMPKHVFISPKTLLRCIYLEGEVFKHAFDVVDKGIDLPLLNLIAA